uniref:Uncharacterized protein n=1 Tax=Graphocephala atropunctata TaxID=36148 RepID=A0A1B6LCF1_9HEMI
MLSCFRITENSSCQIGASASFSFSFFVILAARQIVLLFAAYHLIMSSIPQGAFAAFKVRQGMVIEKPIGFEKYKEEKQGIHYPPVNSKLVDQSPLKYNSKMMNSIWGQYNRYSVHNMKKNTDAKEVLLWAEQRLSVLLQSF